MSQVHKETLTQIENALPTRSGIDQEVFGMEGIPEDVTEMHNERVKQEFFAQQGYHSASTGNPLPGDDNAQREAKKPKVKETPEELKKRLAEHRAARAAQKAAAAAGGSPASAVSNSYTIAPSHADRMTLQTASPSTAQLSGAPPAQPTPPQNGFTHPYGQPPAVAQAPPSFEYNPQHMQPAYGMPPQQAPYGAPGQFGMPMAPFASSPPPGFGPPPGFSHPPGFGPPPGMPGFHPGTPYMPGHPMHMPSRPSPHPQGHHYGPPTGPPAVQSPAPPQYSPPQRQNSLPDAPGLPAAVGLPPAPGLPARPSFDAPQVSRSQLQEMHRTQFSEHHAPSAHSQPEAQNMSSSIDDLISTAQQNTSTPVPGTTPRVETPETPAKTNGTPKVATPAPEAGHGKKQKKATRMAYSDDAMSPEEKMAGMKRYAFRPKKGGETFLAPVEAAVTGPVHGAEDALGDAQG